MSDLAKRLDKLDDETSALFCEYGDLEECDTCGGLFTRADGRSPFTCDGCGEREQLRERIAELEAERAG